MCPQKTQKAPSRNPTKHQSHRPQRQHTSATRKPPPQQPTLWNFVQPHLPNPQPLRDPQSQESEVLHLTQTPPTLDSEPPPPPSQQQEPLFNPMDNDAWGDPITVTSPHGMFRVVSKNVSTLNTYSLDMTAIATELQTMDASIFFAQETNTAWKPTTLQAIDAQCNSVFKHKKMATSSSSEKSDHRYQPGGTLTLALAGGPSWNSWANKTNASW